MRRFTTKLEVSTRLQIELRTRSCQLTNTRGPFFDEDLDSFCVSEGGARRQRVLPVQLGRISGAQCGGNAALGIRRRAVEQRPLGQHHHVAVRGSAPCSVEPSNSASHHEKARPYSADHALKSMHDVMRLKGGPTIPSLRSTSIDHDSFFDLNQHRPTSSSLRSTSDGPFVLQPVVFGAILLFR
jgi:hypothetical protein